MGRGLKPNKKKRKGHAVPAQRKTQKKSSSRQERGEDVFTKQKDVQKTNSSRTNQVQRDPQLTAPSPRAATPEDETWQFKPKDVLNISPFAEPTLNVDNIDNFINYTVAPLERRREIMRELCTVVTGWNDNEHYIQAHINMYLKIFHDPQLRGNWNIKISDDLHRRKSFRTLAQKAQKTITDIMSILPATTVKARKPNDKARKAEEKELDEWSVDRYEAPSTRLRITPNLTFDQQNVIPVYTDLPNETAENVTIPNALLYDYRDANIINGNKEPELLEAVRLSEEPGNTIRCVCHSQEPIVQCFQNKNCPCFLANYSLHRLQEKTPFHSPTTFSTFEPIQFNSGRDHMYEYCAFACSEICGCKGNCTNNVMLIPDKKVIPFELFRKHLGMGFCLRSPVLIPAGTPLMEFTGDLMEAENLPENNVDYAFQLTYSDDVHWRKLLDQFQTFTPDYKKLLKQLSHKVYHIDPKVRGNAARTACHSCVYNCDVLRVYQKSLSPAHIRFLFVSAEDIFPGVPLSLDYGNMYMKNQLLNVCLCGSVACHNHPRFEESKNYDLLELAERIGHSNKKQSLQYLNEVSGPANRKLNAWITEWMQDGVPRSVSETDQPNSAE